MKLNVSEVFYSIQGEGVTMGIPAVFLRLGGCNLLCKGKGWVCDTIAVWSKSKATPFDEVLSEEFVQRLKNGAHLVITGGEPLLHQEKVNDYINWFWKKYNYLPFIEVETNGTIIPKMPLVQQWNCSPKLSNSGESVNRRINEAALTALKDLNAMFKFVICSEEDVLEVLQDFNLPNTVFMPGGDTQELLNITRPIVAELCVRLGVRYSDRLHVTIWNKKTGV
jgi:organic radical activating enzyme